MLNNVAADLMALGRFAEAIPYLRLALQEEPAAATRARLAECLMHTGKDEEGRALLKEGR
jgi:thioredoxin-like negative regulator of GroEL